MAIILTESAAAEIQRYMEAEKVEDDKFLRIGVTGGGCSGLNYTMTFDSNYERSVDAQSEIHGIRVVIDKKSALYLDGAKVDWLDNNGQRGFSFQNPNVASGCAGGCGH